MKIIGITGKAGAGKTTFSDYLGAKEGICKNKKTTVISNKRNKEDLEKIAEQIYREDLKKSGDTVKERYKSTIPIKVPCMEREDDQNDRRSEKTLS